MELVWHDAVNIGVEGRGWDDTVYFYDRLPRKAESLVREPIWRMSHSSTGMCLRFRTNAREIHARWRLLKSSLGESNFNRCADSGLDLYGNDSGSWRWVAATLFFDSQSPEMRIVEGLDGAMREYLLYLPLRNQLAHLEIGVPASAEFAAIAPREEGTLVFYGTSIVHGAYASRCGMVYTAMLGRRLDRPLINLGFSGNARMDPEMADLLGELDASVYIIDPMPNMTMELVEANAEKFVRRLRGHCPTTPIVMVEDFPRTNCWALPQKERDVREKNARLRVIVDGLVASGLSGLHYVEGAQLLGADGEASIDGIHPGDIGMLRIADALEPVIRACVEEPS
jgi:hypothetical protein